MKTTPAGCHICAKPYDDHTVVRAGEIFELVCPGSVGRFTLGPTSRTAFALLSRRTAPTVAGRLWEELDRDDVADGFELVIVGQVHDDKGRTCRSCPTGWPQRCVDHGGGCDGYMHATLRDRKRTHRGDRLPDRNHVRFTYEERRPGRYGPPFNAFGLTIATRCSVCASPASQGERANAVRRLLAGKPTRKAG